MAQLAGVSVGGLVARWVVISRSVGWFSIGHSSVCWLVP